MAIEIKQTSCLIPLKTHEEVVNMINDRNDRRVIVKKFTISDAITEGLIMWIAAEKAKMARGKKKAEAGA